MDYKSYMGYGKKKTKKTKKVEKTLPKKNSIIENHGIFLNVGKILMIFQYILPLKFQN